MQVSAQWDVCNWRHMREEIVVGGLKSEKFTPHCDRVSRRMHKGDIYWHSCCFWKEICWLHFYSLLTDYFYLSKITPIQQLSSSCCRISSTSKISILLKTFHSSGNPILNWIPNRISLFTYRTEMRMRGNVSRYIVVVVFFVLAFTLEFAVETWESKVLSSWLANFFKVFIKGFRKTLICS